MKRWPAFSLIEISIVLFIMGLLLTRIPVLLNFYKTFEAKQQIDLAIKSLGAHVAKNLPLPIPDNMPSAESDASILRGTLPYKTLGIKRKGTVVRYAVDRALTDPGVVLGGMFCNDFPNNFQADGVPEKDLIAFELSAGSIKTSITRNNFVAQYCGRVCKSSF